MLPCSPPSPECSAGPLQFQRRANLPSPAGQEAGAGTIASALDFQAHTASGGPAHPEPSLDSARQASPPHAPLQAELWVSFTLRSLLLPSTHTLTPQNLLESVTYCCSPSSFLCSCGTVLSLAVITQGSWEEDEVNA